MGLVCCGISHRTSTVAEREPFQISREQLGATTVRLKQLAGVDEIAVLITCHRIEFYCTSPDGNDPRLAISRLYSERDLPVSITVDQRWFVRQESSVARHLFKVAAGLDSPLIGEHQVLGQVKAAYSAACAVSGPGKVLHKLFHYAFKTAKRVRLETDIGIGAQGLAGAALDIARATIPDQFAGLKVVVVGVNESTAMLLPRLVREQAAVKLVNRTLYKAEKVARPFNIQALSLEQVNLALSDADLLISATAAPGYVVNPSHLVTRNKNKPLLIIDLAVPRDVDPAVRNFGFVSLWDLDDLKHHLEQSEQSRASELPCALQLIEEGVREFEQWRRTEAAAGNGALREVLELDRRAIMDQFRNDFRSGDLKVLDAFSHRLYRQFLRRIKNLPETASSPTSPPQDN